MRFLNTLTLVLLATVAFSAQADDGRFSEVTAVILDLKHDNSFPAAKARVTYEYGCADRFLRIEQTKFTVSSIQVRVVLSHNNYLRCLWQNPRQETEYFTVNNTTPTVLVALQPGSNPPVAPVEILEVNTAVSVVLMSRQYQAELSKLQQPLRKGYLSISNISTERLTRSRTVVKVAVQEIVIKGFLQTEVKDIGSIHFYLSQPADYHSYIVSDSKFVPAPPQ